MKVCCFITSYSAAVSGDGLSRNVIGYANLSDIVQVPSAVERREFLGAKVQMLSERQGTGEWLLETRLFQPVDQALPLQSRA